jgi:hypothetical protein
VFQVTASYNRGRCEAEIQRKRNVCQCQCQLSVNVNYTRAPLSDRGRTAVFFSHTRTSRLNQTRGSSIQIVLSIIVMPPLPTTFDDATNASIASIQRRQNDLHEFQLPRLRGCSESLTVQQQYAAELREDLETITRLVEVSLFKRYCYSCIMGCQ